MAERVKNKKRPRRVKKSIRNQIIATALCPLLAMSTSVSVLAMNGFNEMLIANIIAFILFVGVIQLALVTRNIVGPLRKIEEYMLQLSDGDLNIEVDKKISKREDEIGVMFESMMALSQKLNNSMTDIQLISEKLISSEEVLGKTVEETNIATEQIGFAMKRITGDTKKQSDNMNKASVHIDEIGSMIGNILRSIQHLEETSGGMKEDGRQSVKNMNDLDESNKRMNYAIERISQQVNLTYEAAAQINSVLQMIAGISKQTGLLALNASIEAARAGEHGAGFSVVAEEISKLASQSSESTKQIDEIVGNLSTESGKMLMIMDEVLTDVEKQKTKLLETQKHFEKVNEGIEDSLQEISEIRERTQVCNVEKDKIIENIESLRNVSEESVESTLHTQKAVIELSKNIDEVESMAVKLSDYAERLDNHLQYFSIK